MHASLTCIIIQQMTQYKMPLMDRKALVCYPRSRRGVWGLCWWIGRPWFVTLAHGEESEGCADGSEGLALLPSLTERSVRVVLMDRKALLCYPRSRRGVWGLCWWIGRPCFVTLAHGEECEGCADGSEGLGLLPSLTERSLRVVLMDRKALLCYPRSRRGVWGLCWWIGRPCFVTLAHGEECEGCADGSEGLALLPSLTERGVRVVLMDRKALGCYPRSRRGVWGLCWWIGRPWFVTLAHGEECEGCACGSVCLDA